MEIYSDNPNIFIKKAEILKILSHPVRLCIVKRLLEKGSSNVTNMYNCLDMPQSTISQHISKLKSVGIINGDRNGLKIIYSVCNEDVKKIIEVLF
ncbi:ArsR/SmtB family transcription factor [Tepidibacter hydrothermalis]|uniref:Metalloregulator ArsR/SmtB family transcription factor n=1 Tax=Tepidibacter hydrothermalis TaxID=3036126 RepID=A0ABY8ED85_9FIRM|nr:metalloregulator ArsR/SmtB family transcription factor [Tepidibacter hydrothermalis]WFD10899.1 metalloregulator ArsR/SmtB family transcription factor [Tepidibacter hydrothermalis]